jgi:hypothetical protein
MRYLGGFYKNLSNRDSNLPMDLALLAQEPQEFIKK